MKLSDIKDESRFGILDEAAVLIEKLAKNEDFRAMMFKDDIDPNTSRGEAGAIMSQRIKKGLPHLMSTASAEIAEYLALVEGVSVEEYKKDMTLGKLFVGVTDMLNDPIFLNFFYLYAPTEQG